MGFKFQCVSQVRSLLINSPLTVLPSTMAEMLEENQDQELVEDKELEKWYEEKYHHDLDLALAISEDGDLHLAVAISQLLSPKYDLDPRDDASFLLGPEDIGSGDPNENLYEDEEAEGEVEVDLEHATERMDEKAISRKKNISKEGKGSGCKQES